MSKDSLPNKIIIKEYCSLSEFKGLESVWETLFHDIEFKSIAYTFKWNKIWIDVFFKKYICFENNLKILTFSKLNPKSKLTLIGIAPLYLKNNHKIRGFNFNRIGFIGTGEEIEDLTYPPYLGVICAENHKLTINQELSNYLKRNYSIFDLYQTNIQGIENQVEKMPFLNKLISTTESVSYQSLITSDFETYLQSLSKSPRKNSKKSLKDADSLNIKLVYADTIEEALIQFEELVELHQEYWIKRGLKGAFSTKEIKDFHINLISTLFTDNKILLNKLVDADNKTISVVYGFVFTNPDQTKKFELYQCGINYDLGDKLLQSPGITHHLFNLRDCSKLKITEYDFLTGEAEYKRRLSNSERKLFEMTIWRLSFKLVLSKVFGKFNGI